MSLFKLTARRGLGGRLRLARLSLDPIAAALKSTEFVQPWWLRKFLRDVSGVELVQTDGAARPCDGFMKRLDFWNRGEGLRFCEMEG